MANLETKYLGLTLKNPFIVGSSELNNSVEKIKQHEASGAGAIVLKSLFEEQILMNIDAERLNNMYGSYDAVEDQIGYYLKKHNVDSYLKLIKEAKAAVNIPVIASINCVSSVEWIDFAKKIEEAGADAIEVNMFIMPLNVDMEGQEIENTYFDIANKVSNAVSIPVALKVSNYISGLANFLQGISKSKIKGLVLFNKFYAPAVDIENEKIISSSIYSKEGDNSNTLRWIAILNGQVEADLCASTGVHTAKDFISNILVGANAVQVVSAIFEKGEKCISDFINELNVWMDKKGYKNIDDFRGKLSQKEIKNPMLYERAQFMKYFSGLGK